MLDGATWPVAGWLPPLVHLLRHTPRAGVVTGMLVEPDGRLVLGGTPFHIDKQRPSQLPATTTSRRRQHVRPMSRCRPERAVRRAPPTLPRVPPATAGRSGTGRGALRTGPIRRDDRAVPAGDRCHLVLARTKVRAVARGGVGMADRRALVVSYHTPQPDRDSGSRRVFHFLELLQEEGWEVTVLAADGTGPSTTSVSSGSAGLPSMTATRRRSRTFSGRPPTIWR